MSLKYKVGDIVKITDSQHGHRLNIGEVVRISEVLGLCYGVKYLDGHDWWAVGEDEIELYEEPKMPKYTTEPIDYTGCHPVIAEHLKRGEAILCRVWKNEKGKYTNFLVTNFLSGAVSEYRGHFRSDPESNLYWRYAEPIPVKRKVLMSAEKAVVKLIENGWKLSPDCTEIQKPGTGLILECLKEREGMERSMLELYPDYLFEEEEEVEVDD